MFRCLTSVSGVNEKSVWYVVMIQIIFRYSEKMKSPRDVSASQPVRCVSHAPAEQRVASYRRAAYNTLQAGRVGGGEPRPARRLSISRDLISPSGQRGRRLLWGLQTGTRTGFLSAERSALKGQGSDLRHRVRRLPRRGKSGWGRVTRRRAPTLVWSSDAGGR